MEEAPDPLEEQARRHRWILIAATGIMVGLPLLLGLLRMLGHL